MATRPGSGYHLLLPPCKGFYDTLANKAPMNSNTPEGLRSWFDSLGDVYGPHPSSGVNKSYDKAIPGPGGNVPLRIYEPEGEGPFPIIIYFHGGGFVIGNNTSHGSVAAHLSAACKAVVLAVDYRLAPEHPFPGAVEDGWAATSWAAANAGEINGNAGQIVTCGESAGGTLAAVMALIDKEKGAGIVKAQVLVCPCCDMAYDSPSFKEFENDEYENAADIQWFFDLYMQGQDVTQPHAAPIRFSDFAGLPPAFILTAEVDVLRDEGETYGMKLVEAGVKVLLKRYKGHFHNSMFHVTMTPDGLKTYAEISEFLKLAMTPAVEE